MAEDVELVVEIGQEYEVGERVERYFCVALQPVAANLFLAFQYLFHAGNYMRVDNGKNGASRFIAP